MLSKLPPIAPFRRTCLGLSLLLAAAQALGQSPAPVPATGPAGGPPLPWAAVAIHQVQPDRGGGNYESDRPDGFNDHGLNLREILSQAYNFSVLAFREDQVEGLPEWARTTRYDITARVDPDDVAAFKKLSDLSMHDTTEAYAHRQPTGEMLMVRTLLADRFHLKVHWETRERSVYALTVAKSGIRMKPAADPEHGDMNFNRGHLSGHGVPCSFLVGLLAMPAGRLVVDRTGAAGAYDFDLHFTPTDGPSNAGNSDPNTADPDFFTALQEQLGLKLESTRMQVPVLIVDHVEQPTPN